MTAKLSSRSLNEFFFSALKMKKESPQSFTHPRLANTNVCISHPIHWNWYLNRHGAASKLWEASCQFQIVHSIQQHHIESLSACECECFRFDISKVQMESDSSISVAISALIFALSPLSQHITYYVFIFRLQFCALLTCFFSLLLSIILGCNIYTVLFICSNDFAKRYQNNVFSTIIR